MAYLAGVQGALRAYEAILHQHPSDRSRWMDNLVEKRERGELASTVLQLMIERACK